MDENRYYYKNAIAQQSNEQIDKQNDALELVLRHRNSCQGSFSLTCLALIKHFQCGSVVRWFCGGGLGGALQPAVYPLKSQNQIGPQAINEASHHRINRGWLSDLNCILPRKLNGKLIKVFSV